MDIGWSSLVLARHLRQCLLKRFLITHQDIDFGYSPVNATPAACFAMMGLTNSLFFTSHILRQANTANKRG
jgi:hypothetical protein